MCSTHTKISKTKQNIIIKNYDVLPVICPVSGFIHHMSHVTRSHEAGFPRGDKQTDNRGITDGRRYPTITLIRGGLESSGQRLISSNAITKRTFFPHFFYLQNSWHKKLFFLDFKNFWGFLIDFYGLL